MYLLREVKKILYRLKRQWGVTITIFRNHGSQENLENGVLVPNFTEITVKRVIVMLANQARKFVYDIAYLAANKNFTYGALFDLTDRIFIIDQKELPSNFEPRIDDFLVVEGERYKPLRIERIMGKYGYLLAAKNLTNDTVPVMGS